MAFMEKGVPVKIIESKDKGNYIVVFNFEKPVGKKMVKLVSKLLDVMRKDVSAD